MWPAGGADRTHLALSAGAEPAEFRSRAAARRSEELNRLLSIPLGPAGARARESEVVPAAAPAPDVPPAVPVPVITPTEARPMRLVLVAVPAPERDAPARAPLSARPLAPPEAVAAVPAPVVAPNPAREVASLHAPDVLPEPPGPEVETHIVTSDPPSVAEWNTIEPPPAELSEQPIVRLPRSARLPPARVVGPRPRVRTARAVARARLRASRRAAARRAAQPAAAALPSQYQGWPADAFLQPPAQTPRPRRGRARSSEPQ